MVKIYVAHAMTGRPKVDVLAESGKIENYANALNAMGSHIFLLDPVVAEGVKREAGVIDATPDQVKTFWARDKAMIREADVLLDLTGPAKSEGVAHEIGYARYCLWKPVVRVYDQISKNSIANFEDDFITTHPLMALLDIERTWGTWLKRFVWRFKMMIRCLPKWLYYQAKEWF